MSTHVYAMKVPAIVSGYIVDGGDYIDNRDPCISGVIESPERVIPGT